MIPAPLRVLYLINSLGTGGAERSLAELIAPLRERGIELTVAVLRDSDDRVDVVAPVHRVGDGNALRRAREVRRLLDDLQTDVLHTTIFQADLLGRVARLRTGVPLLCSLVNTTYDPARWSHDATLPQAKVRAAQALDALTGPAVDRFHAISQAVADSATRNLRIAPDRISVVHRGRDPLRLGTWTPERRDRARAELGIGDAPLVLTIGRHEEQKGHRFLLEAMSAILAAEPRARLVIAGRRGNVSEDLERRIASLALGGSVELAGHRDDVADLLVAADCFVFPSTYEGLGGAVLEAMALRCPIVASDLPVLREAAGDGGAVFVPTGDSRALADAVRDVLGDPVARAARAEAAHARFEAKFTLERSAAAMADLYRDVARRGGRPGARVLMARLAGLVRRPRGGRPPMPEPSPPE